MAVLKWIFIYGLQVLAVSVVGVIAPTLYYCATLIEISIRISALDYKDGLFIFLISAAVGKLFLVKVVLPLCLFVFAPLAIIVNQFLTLTLLRTLLLSLLIVGPGIIFSKYHSHPEHNAPGILAMCDHSDEYHPLTGLHPLDSTMITIMLMPSIPIASAALCAVTLWFLRFRAPKART